jgi:hypothetical protein
VPLDSNRHWNRYTKIFRYSSRLLGRVLQVLHDDIPERYLRKKKRGELTRFRRPLPRPGLSNSLKLPCWRVFDWTFAPWEIRKLISTTTKIQSFGISKIDDNYFANYFEYALRLKSQHAHSLVNESNQWEEIYLPNMVSNKTILDVGSGCGETMAFFFAPCAKKVVGIDADPEACMFARVNIWENRWNAEVINEPFSLRHLSFPHDFLKVNAEGAEQILLSYENALGTCAIKVSSFSSFDLPKAFEQHFPHLAQVFRDKSGSIVLNGCDDCEPLINSCDEEVGNQRKVGGGTE